MTAKSSSDAALKGKGNYDVDYVIRYCFGGPDREEAKEQLKDLLKTLAGVGFQTEVRPGDRSSLLVFIRATDKSLLRATHTTRVRDWLYGLRNTQPDRDSSLEPQTDAERLRAIYFILTAASADGGANITPKFGKWKRVDSLFPLHDDTTNQAWMRNWSSKTFLTSEDLDQIRDKFGEQVGFYFTFLQTYLRFLFFPALFGFSSWLVLGYYSPIYAIVNCIWCVVFVEYWKRREQDLALRWQVRGVSVLSSRNRGFQPESEVRDQATGELRPVFPWTKRLQRQMLQIPFALVSIAALGAVIATCFAIEIFISEVYNGPLKSYLVFIPTVLLSSILPVASTILNKVAKRLTEFENYETKEEYDVAMIQKTLVINFITSYLAIFLTAFVYVPFAQVIVPYLDIFRATVRPFVSREDEKTIHHTEFKIDPNRLRNQVIYFAVTAQIVNFFLETILPFILQRLSSKYKQYSEEKANGHEKASAAYDDHPDEIEFLKKVRDEADLPEYDTTDDLRQMVIQFGYLSLFSTVWPLVPVSFLFNNWLELRSDFFKICKEFKRPVPERADTIGPWLDTLGLLAWVGSITSPALVYLAQSQDLNNVVIDRHDEGSAHSASHIRGWMLMTTIFFSEHIYLGVRYAVEKTIAKIEMPSIAQEQVQKILMRKELIAEIPSESLSSSSQEDLAGSNTTDATAAADENITRTTLEEDARARTLHDACASDPFWERQKNWKEAMQIGSRIIESCQSAEAKKRD